MVMRTYYPPRERDWDTPGASESAPARDPLHGYTTAQIDHLTRLTLRMDRWHTARDIDERYDAVRHAIVVHLLQANQPPHRGDLLRAGTTASDQMVRDEMRTHGRDTTNTGRPMPAYYRYWGPIRSASPETRVIERQTVAQIWPLLRPSEQRALAALAETGDYELAAAACSVKKGTFSVLISTARRRFLAYWHEGETPSRIWRTDRHISYRNSRDPLGRQRLTASQVNAYRERYQDGEHLRALGAEAGVSATTLSRLIRGLSNPAPEAS